MIEFRATRRPQLRNQRVAHVRGAAPHGAHRASPAHPHLTPRPFLRSALVHFALDESREQPPARWSGEKLARMSAEVTLPHCMQTSARFWERVGFHLGREVDNHEPKMAVLRELQGLDVADGWISRGARRRCAAADGGGRGVGGLGGVRGAAGRIFRLTVLNFGPREYAHITFSTRG